MIDWTIRLGDIMVLGGLATSAIILAFKAGGFARSIKEMQQQIVELKDIAKMVGSVLTTVAVQKVEIEHLRSDIDELRHGEGFVMPVMKPRTP